MALAKPEKTSLSIHRHSGVLPAIYLPLYHQGKVDLVKAQDPDMVRWTNAVEGAFTDLHTALCSNPMLIALDFSKEFILQMDASKVGLRALLSPMVREDEHPILYLSRKLLLRKQKYIVVEKECLAAKWKLYDITC